MFDLKMLKCFLKYLLKNDSNNNFIIILLLEHPHCYRWSVHFLNHPGILTRFLLTIF